MTLTRYRPSLVCFQVCCASKPPDLRFGGRRRTLQCGGRVGGCAVGPEAEAYDDGAAGAMSGDGAAVGVRL